jgi:hypothetical protein
VLNLLNKFIAIITKDKVANNNIAIAGKFIIANNNKYIIINNSTYKVNPVSMIFIISYIVFNINICYQ